MNTGRRPDLMPQRPSRAWERMTAARIARPLHAPWQLAGRGAARCGLADLRDQVRDYVLPLFCRASGSGWPGMGHSLASAMS